MKTFKNIVLFLIIGFLMIFVYFQLIYNPCDSYRFKSNPQKHHGLVIANEGSYFKDSVSRILVQHFESQSVQVQVLPLQSLSKLKLKDVSAVVIIHSWHTWNPPREVEHFVKKQGACLDKIILMTTSSDGTHKMDDIDAITGESKIEDAASYATLIIQKLNPLLNHHNP